jgi:hypothetical protein
MPSTAWRAQATPELATAMITVLLMAPLLQAPLSNAQQQERSAAAAARPPPPGPPPLPPTIVGWCDPSKPGGCGKTALAARLFPRFHPKNTWPLGHNNDPNAPFKFRVRAPLPR